MILGGGGWGGHNQVCRVVACSNPSAVLCSQLSGYLNLNQEVFPQNTFDPSGQR